MPDGRVESCGHFHGAPVGFACDFLAIAAAEIGAIAERRTDRLLDRNRSHGLPPFLARTPGVNSGMMIAHYTQAAMVAENRRLAAPPASTRCRPRRCRKTTSRWAGVRPANSANRSPTSAGFWPPNWSAPPAASSFGPPLPPSAPVAAAVRALRAAGVEGPGPDRWLAPELASAEQLVMSGTLLAAVEAIIGPLN